MRQIVWHLMVVLVGVGLVQGAQVEEYRLMTGDFIAGEPISVNEDGVVFRLPDGRFSTRAGWTNFTQESLEKLAALPNAKRFVEPFLIVEEEPEEAEQEKVKKEIRPKPVPRLSQLDARAGLGALFRSPISLTLFVLIYLANLYAGYEISVFRNYPAALVCASAALLPVIGPVVFLSLPTRIPVAEEEYGELSPEEAAYAEGQEGAPAQPAPAAQAASQGPQIPQPVVYLRGQTTFNRRFFETKLANFIRVVPGEAEKDMLIAVKSARGDYVGNRISRVTPNELHLQVTKGGVSADVTIPFTEIKEIVVRHKEA